MTPAANKASRLNWSMKEFLRARKYAVTFYKQLEESDISLSDETDACHWMRDEKELRLSWKKINAQRELYDRTLNTQQREVEHGLNRPSQIYWLSPVKLVVSSMGMVHSI